MNTRNLIRLAGLAAMGAGILFVLIQPIHPPDVLASIPTARWVVVHSLGVVMAFLGVLGVPALYARQVNAAGWLGLAGCLLLCLFFAITLAFQFTEAFLLPVLVTAAPTFVEGFLGIVSGQASETNLGALPAVYALTGILYVLGGLLFGIATLRAGILPRWAAVLLAFGTVLPLLVSWLIPHPFDRIFAVPVGVALACLGYALWSEREEQAAERVPGRGVSRLRQTGAE